MGCTGVHGYKSTIENTTIYEVTDPIMTASLGEIIGSRAKNKEIYTLSGDLGVGKTLFSNSFGKGFGIKEKMTSPTYTIINEYNENNNELIHMDCYRIEDENELDDIGFFDYLERDAIFLIEWPEMIKNTLKNIKDYNIIEITIEKNLHIGENYRLIKVKNL